jgi:predicted dehydrogenase
MGHLVTRVGMIGVSEGNGHPFSFSSIINGYSDDGLGRSGWDGIHQYVRVRDVSEFGIQNLRVTHAWSQDESVTKRLCESAQIENTVKKYEEIVGEVDAVIIARDDFDEHLKIARPFLEAGLPVFIDKPLSLRIDELNYYKPFLEQGKLMSCSGLRYANELDFARKNIPAYGNISLVRGTVLFSWEKYGVHMVEAILSLLDSRPVSVFSLPVDHFSVIITMSDGLPVYIDAMGMVPKIFRVDIVGEKRVSTHEVSDNFSMFRRMLWHFAEMIRTGKSVIPACRTLDIMKVLIAGRLSRSERRTVSLDEFDDL